MGVVRRSLPPQGRAHQPALGDDQGEYPWVRCVCPSSCPPAPKAT